MRTIRFSSIVNAPREKVFDFYEKVESLMQITPPKMAFWAESDHERMVKGAEIILHFRVLRLFSIGWVKKIVESMPPERFEDIQESGPLQYWHHKHLFVQHGIQTEVIDEVDYELPLGFLGALIDLVCIRRVLNRMFRFRHRRTTEIFG